MKLLLASILIAFSYGATAQQENAIFLSLQDHLELVTEQPDKIEKELYEHAKDSASYSTKNKYYLSKLYGFYFKQKGLYENSIQSFQSCLNSTYTHNEQSDLNYQIAANHYNLSQYEKSIFYLTKNLNSKNIAGEQLAKTHSLLGLSYSMINDYSHAEIYLNKAVTIFKELADTLGLSQTYSNLGELSSKRGKTELALDYFKKAYTFLKENNDLFTEIALSNIGVMYLELNQLDSAQFYTDKAYKLSQELDDKLGELISINNLATIYKSQKEYTKALSFYQKALEMVDELGSREEKKQILFNLSELNEMLGNFDESLHYYKAFAELKDDIFNKEKAEFVIETQEKYAASQREKEIVKLRLNQEKKEAQFMRLVYLTIIGSIAFLFITFAIIFWYRYKRNQEKIKHKFMLVNAAIEAEEKERIRISQDIHDDLGGLLGISRMLFTKTHEYVFDKNEELYTQIDGLLLQANQRSRAISHELFSPTLKQFGIFEALNEYTNNVQNTREELSIKVTAEDIRFDPQLELNLFRISQELLHNTLKYANAKNIEIEIKKTDNALQYTYTDDGSGFDDKVVKMGVGLNSISARIQRLQGQFKIETGSAKGFRLEVRFPLG